MDSETAIMDKNQVSTGNPIDTDMPIELLPSQMANLEMINHLASYSELMVLVVGPQGSGKSFVAAALQQAKSEKTYVLAIDAAGLGGIPDLTQRIADHWGLGRMPEAAEQQRQLLINAAQYHDGQGNGLLVVIDDAHLLDADTLNEIAVLAKLVRQGLAIVLCGDSGFELQLRGSPSQAEVHPIILPPLNNLEVRQLARQYCAKRSIDIPLETILESLSDAVDWYPADVIQHIEQQQDAASVADIPFTASMSDKLSNEATASNSPAPAKTDTESQPSAVSTTKLLLSLLLLAAAVAVVILLDRNPSLITPSLVDSDAASAEAAAVEMVGQVVDEVSSEASGEIKTEIKETAETQSVVTLELAEVKDYSGSSVTAVTAADDQGVSTQDSAAQTSAAQTSASQNQEPQNSVSSIKDIAPMATVKPIDAAEPMVAMQEAPVAELAVNKSIQQPARKDSPSATQVVVNSGSDSELLMAADIGYVVQLLGASQRASANKFIQDWQPNVAKQLYQYRTQFRQKDWFVVVLGIFPDRAAAQTAVSQLPKQLRSAKPWVRPLADVQKVLE